MYNYVGTLTKTDPFWAFNNGEFLLIELFFGISTRGFAGLKTSMSQTPVVEEAGPFCCFE